ncbi:hypothetical protein FRC17_000152 [Serendipita sp. 399]|nr:hypothetical protein FRC17_000152 [Serendipita sp. 399]
MNTEECDWDTCCRAQQTITHGTFSKERFIRKRVTDLHRGYQGGKTLANQDPLTSLSPAPSGSMEPASLKGAALRPSSLYHGLNHYNARVQECQLAITSIPRRAVGASHSPENAADTLDQSARASASKPRKFQPRFKNETPKNVCKFYYNTGSCDRDRCTYRHTEPANSRFAQHTESNGGPSEIRRGDDMAIFLRPAEFSAVTPSDALHQLSVLFAPTTKFTKPLQIKKVVNLLTNAGLRDGTWNSGLSTIEKILTFDPVVVQVNASRDAISFASAYVPCLAYFVSGFVLDSTLGIRVNHFDRISTVIMTCMTDIVTRKSFESKPFGIGCGTQIFSALIQVLVEYINRFKGAFRDHELLLPLTESLSSWVTLWKTGNFIDRDIPDAHTKRVTLDKLDKDLQRLRSMAIRESAAITRKAGLSELASTRRPHSTSFIGPLTIHYDPAGNLRPDGPRHDNDFEDIRMIFIHPTEAEMTSKISPFLPANIPGAPHHLPSESMERLLDIQFRLLREELIAPLRLTIQMITSDLHSASGKTPLHSLMAKRGGRYIAETGHDSVMASVYTSANPMSITTDKRGMAVEISFDAPPGQARSRSVSQRAEYWKAISRKRLIQGGLVGIVWATQESTQIFFGLISSSVEDLERAARKSPEILTVRVKFFDDRINLKVIEWCQLSPKDRLKTTILMVEASVMYESIRPFLQALQREPTTFPFSRYLVHRSDDPQRLYLSVNPPLYTTTRRSFVWNLRCIMNQEGDLLLDSHDASSIRHARDTLRSSSRLDPSQADAMIDCLTKEFCLIQGPPGTGKSFTGVEIMRVLLANGMRKILLIAFTNHALDHLLQSVLKTGITSKIARLGSRSNDEILKKYSLDGPEGLASSRTKDKAIDAAYRTLRATEKGLETVLKQLQGGPVSMKDQTEYIQLCHPHHHEQLMHPPEIVNSIRSSEKGWTQVGDGSRHEGLSLYEFWKLGRDITWIEQMCSSLQPKVKPRSSNKYAVLNVEWLEDDDTSSSDGDSTDSEDGHKNREDDQAHRLETFLRSAGLSALPPVPSSRRSIDELREEPRVWTMSRNERTRLAKAWEEAARQHFFSRNKDSFSTLKAVYENAKQAPPIDSKSHQAKLRILHNVDIIGCTTTGAAKLTNLLSGTRPSVLLVEEAGQVLEAHVLGSLVSSVEHVIMIGDPLQLRPTINNYMLSMDHAIGKKIYKFDQSTMERLDGAGMGMSQLNVQRRMRPEISSIARETLYPRLEDNIVVTAYPAVRGLARSLFFFHHTHPEGGAEDESVSKYNTFEITMIKALVQHLLRQGSYTKSGSIVVLCMYLGQLAKLRDELRKSRINFILDERDEEELRNREGDAAENDNEEPPVQVVDVKLSDQVLLRTVDNFQGEEADIVILSLVRNHGPEKMGTIGFLKSPNRVNVALTRARHGIFVFGNGDLLSSKSTIWAKVIEYFKRLDSYGTALPIACHRHPESVQWVKTADKLREVSPEGEKLHFLRLGERNAVLMIDR